MDYKKRKRKCGYYLLRTTVLFVISFMVIGIGCFNRTVIADTTVEVSADNPIQLVGDVIKSIDITTYTPASIKGAYKVGDETGTNYWFVSGGTDNGTMIEISIDHENNLYSLTVKARSQCLDMYTINVIDTADNEHVYYVNVTQNGGSGGQTGPVSFVYDGQNYQVGVANGSSDGTTLHIDGGGIHQVDDQNDTQMTFFIGVGKLNDQNQLTGSASQDVIDMVLANLTVTSSDTSVVTVSEPTNYHFNDKTVTGGVNTLQYTLSYPNKKKGTYKLSIAFSVDSKSYAEEYEVIFRQTTNLNVNVEEDADFIALSGNTVVDKLNTLFAKDLNGNNTAYINFVKARNGGKEPDNDTEVNFLFKKNTTYTGLINIDCPFNKINFTTGDVNNSEIKSFAIIDGGIANRGGFVRVERLKFSANSSYKVNYNGSQVTAGLFASMSNTGSGDIMMRISDIYRVSNCFFNGYNYGTLSYEYGMVSGISGCTFTNNDVAVCMDTTNNNYYSDSRYNTFADNGVAIYLARRSQNTSALQLVYTDNYFYGTGIDYKVGSSNMNSGIHFFINSYYGTSYAAGMTNANVRGSRVVYEDGSPATITTGPCIRYPESENKYGFDIGETAGRNKLHNSSDMTMHVEDLYNSDVSIDIYDDQSDSDLGTLTFGGNH